MLKAGYIYTSTLYFWNFSTLWISWIYVTGGEKQDSKATRSQGLWHTVTTVKPLSPHILIDINHLLIRWHHIWSTGKKKDTLQYFQQFLDLLCALGHTPSKRRRHWSYECTMNTRKGRKICSSSGLYSYSPMGSDGQMSEK